MQLGAILQALLSHDNTARQQAERELKKLARHAEASLQLLEAAQGASSCQVRQLACVLLRRHIPTLWPKTSAQAKQHVKATLQQIVLGDLDSGVRKAAADVIAAVAGIAAQYESWPELLPWLNQCTQDSNEQHRAMAINLIANLIESGGIAGTEDTLRQYFAGLMVLFQKALQDSSGIVRAAAVTAVGSVLDFVHDKEQASQFQQLVPIIMQAASSSLEAGDLAPAERALEMFQEMAEIPSIPLSPIIPQLVSWCLHLASNTQLSLSLREQALATLQWIARYKPKQLAKTSCVKPILQTLCIICAESLPDDEEDAADESSAPQLASEALDVMAVNLPPKHIFPEVFAFSKAAVENTAAAVRHGAVLALLMVTEGCAAAIRKKLQDVLEVVAIAARDSEAKVREASLVAVGEMAEHCLPEFAEQSASVLPFLYSALQDPVAKVQARACSALEAYCDHLETEDIQGSLSDLVGKLLELMHQGNPGRQLTSIGALAAIVGAAEAAFRPYASAALQTLSPFLQACQDEKLQCRARAMECVGLIAKAVGKEDMQPFMPDFMKAAFQGFALDYSELREYTHGTLCDVADLLKMDFSAYLPEATRFALASLAQKDCSVPAREDGASITQDSESLGSDTSDEEGDADADRSYGVRTGITDEKASATRALGTYAMATGMAYAPYLSDAVEAIKQSTGYFHEDVREQAYLALPGLLHAVQENVPVSPVDSDDDARAVTAAIGGLTKVMQLVGAGACQPHLANIMEASRKILAGEAICQITVDSDFEDLEDEQDEPAIGDEDLLAALTDLLPALAKALGSNIYLPVFEKEHLSPLLARSKASQPEAIRANAVGALGEMVKELGPQAKHLYPPIISVVGRELMCDEAAVRRNAAYALGRLFQHGGAHVLIQHPFLSKALAHVLRGDEAPEVKDNACSAIAWLIEKSGSELPLTQVLGPLLAALPLRVDMEEAECTKAHDTSGRSTSTRTSRRCIMLGPGLFHVYNRGMH
ncbi:hypothetical protein WJX74_003705 [Apatococcus lobatus]|uniref:Importin N-terminal domain-containing protein n=1 Tax=Apatococcus lobatus TaxID=904363 RepID=A0AAW1QBV4_9CHLO